MLKCVNGIANCIFKSFALNNELEAENNDVTKTNNEAIDIIITGTKLTAGIVSGELANVSIVKYDDINDIPKKYKARNK